VADVGTDRERLDTRSKEAAIKANQVVRDFGLERKGLVEEPASKKPNRSACRMNWSERDCVRMSNA
jgi:hypothetical protein